MLIVAAIVIVLVLALFTNGFAKWPSSWSKLQLWVWVHTDAYDAEIEQAQKTYPEPPPQGDAL